MIKVRQSFDELRKGDQIRVKGWQYAPEIVEKLADERLLVAGNGPMANISYDQYDYSLVEDWPYGQGVRFVAIRLPIEKLSLDMQVAFKGSHGSYPFVKREGDEIAVHDVLRDMNLYFSYEHDYNYSLLRVSEAAKLVEDPWNSSLFASWREIRWLWMRERIFSDVENLAGRGTFDLQGVPLAS